MANFKKTGDFYVSKGGDNGNDGLTSDTPKLTIAAAYSLAGSGDVVIVGDGYYLENVAVNKLGVVLEGDGLVIIDGSGLSWNTQMNSVNIVFFNFNNLGNRTSQANTDCIFINVVSIVSSGIGNLLALDNCKLINSKPVNDAISTTYGISAFNTIFINSTCNAQYSTGSIVDNCIFENSLLQTRSDNVIPLRNNCFNNDIQVGGTVLTKEVAISTYPALFVNSVLQPPLFNRITAENITLDFTVEGLSPLLGAGLNGSNIGNVRRGLQVWRNSDAVQNGTLSQIVFNGNLWQIQGENTTGVVTTDIIDFGLTVSSPILTIKGLVNFLDNVPDFDNALLNPNKLDIEAKWAVVGEDITGKSYVPFLLNERMVLDGTGKSNGQSGFDWDNLSLIPMKFIQLRITLRQNYNPA